MREPGTGGVNSDCLAFLTILFARSHRTLYRPQYVGDLGAEMGFSSAQAGEFAGDLQRRGYLRTVSAITPRGPLVQITPQGIRVVQASYGLSGPAEGVADGLPPGAPPPVSGRALRPPADSPRRPR